MGYQSVFSLASFFVVIGFVVVFGFLIFNVARSFRQYQHNNMSPVLTVETTVVAKRMNVSEQNNFAGTDNTAPLMTSSTWYYVTFQVESGDRMEFVVPGKEYGMLAEGDKGGLTFQGTRFLNFTRHLNV